MQFRFACVSVGMIGLTAPLLVTGCAEGEEVTYRADSGQVGTGGAAGAGGTAGSDGTETGGSGGTSTTGSGGTGGTGGFGGGGGSAGLDAGAGKGGTGGSGGKGGSGGATGGSGGATGGSGGATGGTGGATGGSGGATGGTGGTTGGTSGTGGAGGSTDAGGGVDGGTCPPGVSYCNDFERDTVGSMPLGWTRVGGSDGDWQVFFDTSNVFAQNHASSSTFRLCYPNTAPGAPWSGATTVSARVKILAPGSSGTTTAFLCLGYGTGSSNYACLTLVPGSGARIRMNAGGSATDGPLWAAAIAVGTWYDVKISVDASGALSASLGGMPLGSYMPPSAVAGGNVAVATQSAQAAFDTVIVTQP